jgi:adenylylsulfate kinase
MTKTIAIDLDGVLAQYDGWKGPDHYGPPMPGAIAFLESLIVAEMQPWIFTTREGPILTEWLRKYMPPAVLEHLIVTRTKPPAWLYIDDRCWLFKGTFPSIEEIEDFQPWWQKPPPGAAEELQ